MLLFAEAAKEHWKLRVGMLVGLLNPIWTGTGGESQQQRSASGADNVATLKVSRLSQVVPVGFCPDFSYCKVIQP